jgi:UDP-N-acetylglucosamine--N-acetylmuramyl-(pentapeptide) pyrophosphoryl-undecaprenol N-acetylglucosamine transferase
MQTILIAAGGTGGHIFPALAIARELKKTHKIIWLGSKNGMENTLVKDYPIFNVSAVGVRGKSIKQLFFAPFKIFSAIIQTRKIIKNESVEVVLCMGGFVGGIGGLATIFNKPKLILHEQNSIAGTSNKWLNKISYKSFQAFDNTLKNAITCGNPINFKSQEKHKTSNPLKILVLGGSLGARAINEIIPKLNISNVKDFEITHQSGVKNFENVKKLYGDKNVQILAFIDDMGVAYANADLVIARSGAMTISELIYTQTPAILIPFPHAIDNHQVANAKILVNKNCGIMLEEKDLSVEKLDDILQNLWADNSQEIKNMQNNFSNFDKQNPVKIIGDFIKTN